VGESSKVVKTNSTDETLYESLAVAPRLGDEGKVRLERALEDLCGK